MFQQVYCAHQYTIRYSWGKTCLGTYFPNLFLSTSLDYVDTLNRQKFWYIQIVKSPVSRFNNFKKSYVLLKTVAD